MPNPRIASLLLVGVCITGIPSISPAADVGAAAAMEGPSEQGSLNDRVRTLEDEVRAMKSQMQDAARAKGTADRVRKGTKIRIVELANGRLEAVCETRRNLSHLVDEFIPVLLPRVEVVFDKRANRLVATGSRQDVGHLVGMVLSLDQDPPRESQASPFERSHTSAFACSGTPAGAANLSVDISLEGNASKEVEIKLGSRAEKTLQKALPGKITVELPAEGNGEHYLYFRCPGYAEQWVRIAFSDGKIAPEHVDVALRRSRYVILRCAFNTKNNRTLTGDDVVEQRVALSHWTAPRYFSGDWQVWQKFGGTTLQLNFHRLTSEFGFLKPASDTSYDDMKEAPESGYRCNHIEAQKGLVLYCRVNGNRQFGLGYGKILVEDVVDAVPKGIQVIDGRK